GQGRTGSLGRWVSRLSLSPWGPCSSGGDGCVAECGGPIHRLGWKHCRRSLLPGSPAPAAEQKRPGHYPRRLYTTRQAGAESIFAGRPKESPYTAFLELTKKSPYDLFLPLHPNSPT